MSDLAWMRHPLAELCGFRYDVDDQCFRHESGEWINGLGWDPTKNVAQAIRCLEALRPEWDIEVFSFEDWVVTLQLKSLDREKLQEADASLPRAICLSIATALGWEAPTNNGGTT